MTANWWALGTAQMLSRVLVCLSLPLADRNVLGVEPRGVLVRGKDVEG
jgi:hypothetical protein